MHKSIKKSINFLMALLAVLLLLCIMTFFILRLPSVQTFIAQSVTKYISHEFKSTISLGKVNFTFFNKLVVNNLLIKDQNNDTLLYSPKITAGLRQFNRKKGIIKLGRVTVLQPVVALITDSTGMMNINWYLNKFQKKSDTTGNNSSQFYINQIDISDGRFTLANLRNKPGSLPIDFNNLRLSRINGIVENFNVKNDSISLDIYNLGFIENNGFILRRMTTSLLLNKQNIVFKKVSMICDSSIVNADHISIMADSADSFNRFLQEVRLDIALDKSLISSKELRYFVPALKDFNESFWLSGDLSGTISELKGRNIKFSYKDETNLDCDFDFSGLPDIDNTFIFFEINDFRSASRDIEQIEIPGKGKILLPDVLRKLGVVSFSGTFTGFVKDFVAYAKINTTKGLITTDLSMRPEKNNRFRIKGLMRGSKIDLASITGNEKLFGNMTIGANVDGYTDSFKTFAVNLNGNIDSIKINGYEYRDISLTGFFNDKTWDGNIKINEPNIHMDILGMFDFSRELPEFDFTMNLQKANLFNLLIAKSDTSASASMLVTANFTGNSIDNLNGEIKLLNSSFIKSGNKLEIYDFSLKAASENSTPSINLRTDFIDASLVGRYNFSDVGTVISKAIFVLVPAKYGRNTISQKSNTNNFVYEIKLKNTDKLNKFLLTGIQVSENTIIKGSFIPGSDISLSAKAKMLSLNNNVFHDISFDAKFIDTIADMKIKSSSLDLSGVTELKDLNLSLTAVPDHFNFNLNWDNKENILNKGNFEADGIFIPGKAGTGRAFLRIDLQPGEIYSRNELWKIYPSEMLIDSTSVKISRFNVGNGENYFLIDGAVSENSADTLHLKFNGININPVNYLYEKQMKNDPNMIHLALGGIISGKISFSDFYKNFMFESNILINNFTLLGSQYGEIKLMSVWNNQRRVAEVEANNNLDGKRMFDINGYYDPSTRLANIDAIADKLPVDILNPLLKVFASGISGTASGKVKLSGELSKPFLTGSLWASDGNIKIDYLQTRYRFSDSIRFDKTGIKFNNILAKDDRGNGLIVNGAVYHNSFKDFSVDLNLKANDCMVLSTKEKDNDLFYGTAFASGVTTIKSVGPVLKFDISAKTGKNTKFFIPLNSGLSVSENNFITFIDTSTIAKKENNTLKPVAVSSSSSGMEITFDLEVTPDAEVQLVMDPKAGDIIKGTGSGNLNISLDRKGVFKIYGDYTIERGDYLFTLGNIINKSFSVENGGKVSFNGNVEDADIDLKAIYKTKASLYDIMPEDVKLKERIPVECQLLLTGNLFNPVVGFDIYLPTADEKTRSYLKSMIKSDEEMSRQFLFLLVMNSFYTEMAGSQPSTAAMGSTTVGVTTMEMVSNQLSNWLSKISNDFDIGVVYRPGSTQMPNSQEVQVALSTQLLNDKVSINGNFDVAGNKQNISGTGTTSNNSITGAFDIEYRPKVDGKVRFKFFNRSNDNFYINNGIQYTQGIGIFYREDFNKLSDLFKKPVEKSDMKKEKKTQIKKN